MKELVKSDFSIAKTIDRQAVQEFQRNISDAVSGGIVDPLEVELYFRLMIKAWEGDDNKNNGIKHRIQDYSSTEFSKHGRSEVKIGAFEISEMEGGRYDYSSDSKWVELNNKVIEATRNRQEREILLKGIPDGKPLEEVDPDSGEVKKTYRPVKKGGNNSSLKFSFKG